MANVQRRAHKSALADFGLAISAGKSMKINWDWNLGLHYFLLIFNVGRILPICFSELGSPWNI
jgi:hypothetical protein